MSGSTYRLDIKVSFKAIGHVLDLFSPPDVDLSYDRNVLPVHPSCVCSCVTFGAVL